MWSIWSPLHSAINRFFLCERPDIIQASDGSSTSFPTLPSLSGSLGCLSMFFCALCLRNEPTKNRWATSYLELIGWCEHSSLHNSRKGDKIPPLPYCAYGFICEIFRDIERKKTWTDNPTNLTNSEESENWWSFHRKLE